MTKPHVICKDCFYYTYDKNANSYSTAHLCMKRKIESIDLVTGDIISSGLVSCSLERSDKGTCGPNGLNYIIRKAS